ncbi:helix-turn-helix domain-containing protein [Roseateles chitosanitabidus]|uniref:helix-turn-helix domain-containing protein n=1 Tax=Roseateles chitosanitabidus TaxID=65048 RepID=UPI00082CC54D|nr:helix-turn-helix transcriptional regulator [Roseateles chitosanitabidus]
MNTSDADARKAKVTDEHREEAARLRRIWEDRKPALKERGLGTQLQFGLKFGIGSQAAVGFFLNGQTPLSLKAALGFAEGLGCKVADFSPRLATVLGSEAQPTKAEPVYVESPTELSLVRALLGVSAAVAAAPERKRKLMAAAAASMIENGPNDDEAAAIDALAKGLPPIAAPASPAGSQDDWEDTVRSMAENWAPGPERDFLLGFLNAADEAHQMKGALHERNARAHSSTSRSKVRTG